MKNNEVLTTLWHQRRAKSNAETVAVELESYKAILAHLIAICTSIEELKLRVDSLNFAYDSGRSAFSKYVDEFIIKEGAIP